MLLLALILPSVLAQCNISNYWDYSSCPEYKIPEPLKVVRVEDKHDYCGDNLAHHPYIKKQMCGREDLTEDECTRAGCCYNSSTQHCTYPLRPVSSTFHYNSSLLTYTQAEHMCRKRGMRLFCPRSLIDLQLLESHTCGVTWLRGDITTSSSSGRNYTLPYYNHMSCNSAGFSCDIGHPTDDRLTFIRGYPTVQLTHVNKRSKLYTLCVKEVWSLRLFIYPQHFLFNEQYSGYHSMRCAIQYTGHLQVVGSWKFTRANGQVSHSYITYNPESSGVYVNNFYFLPEGTEFKNITEADLGKYECKFTFKDPNGVEAGEMERGGYAYIYSRQQCQTTVNVRDKSSGTSTTQSVADSVDIETLAGVTVTLSVRCKGYPVPVVSADIGDGNRSEPYPPTLTPDHASKAWVLKDFATQVKPWLEYERSISVSFNSTITTLPTLTLVLRKVFVRFSITIPAKQHVLRIGGPKLTLPCAGYGFGALYKADATWAVDGHRLDFDDDIVGQYLSVSRDSASGAVNITLNPASGVISGNYTCTVDTGAGSPQSYSTMVKIQAPPLPSDQPYIKSVDDVSGSMVVAVPVPSAVWNVTEYKTVLVVNGAVSEVSHSGMVTGGEVLTTFDLTRGSTYQVMFTSSNQWGESGDSELSERFTFIQGIPSVAPSLHNMKTGISEVEVQLGQLEGVDQYEIVLYDTDHKMVQTLRSADTKLKLKDLSPGTTYFMAVRGVKLLNDGTEVLGPMSQRQQLETESGQIPAPIGFTGSQLENNGVHATVLLRWQAPKMKLSQLDGYLLEIKQVMEEGSRRKRQALQTISISYTASAFVAKELASGATYEFGLKCVTKQGISKPATSMVETNEDINCPAVELKVANDKCEKPRESADGRYIAYIAQRSAAVTNIDCYLGTGLEYKGRANTTRSGVDCVMWSRASLAARNVTLYQDEVLSHNLCRNYGNVVNSSSPWCFTSDVGEWQDCGVPICGTDNVTVTRTTKSGEVRTVHGYTQRVICLEVQEDEKEIQISSEKIFGSLDCKSPAAVRATYPVNKKNKWLNKIWVKYLLVELVLISVLVVTWVILATRRNVIISREAALSNSCDTKSTSIRTRTSMKTKHR